MAGYPPRRTGSRRCALSPHSLCANGFVWRFCWCDWRAAQVTGPPLQRQGCFASLRDGLRPALTPEPLLPLSGNDEGRPGACPRHTRSAPIATQELSRDNVPVGVEEHRGLVELGLVGAP